MLVDVCFSGLMIIKDSANTSAANPGQQEDFVALTFDCFQNSMFQENDYTSQRFLRKQVHDDELSSNLGFKALLEDEYQFMEDQY